MKVILQLKFVDSIFGTEKGLKLLSGRLWIGNYIKTFLKYLYKIVQFFQRKTKIKYNRVLLFSGQKGERRDYDTDILDKEL